MKTGTYYRIFFMNKSFIYAFHLSSRSWRTFTAAALLFFTLIFLTDYMIHFAAYNVQNIVTFKISFDNAVFLKADDWGPLFMHGFFSTLLTCIGILLGYFFEKRRLYEVRTIRAYRMKKYTYFIENKVE